jgi:hypothetical protein
MSLTNVPTLTDICEHPEMIATLPPTVAVSLLEKIAALIPVLLAQAVTPTGNGHGEVADDRLLTVVELAARLRRSTDYVYRHCDQWGFTRRIGRDLRFSSVGFEKWNRLQSSR